jgi:ribonuclease-3
MPKEKAPSERQMEKRLGVRFKKKGRLRTALTHRSYLHEHPEEDWESNERLEFLGDAVLGYVVAEELFRRFPDLPEGQLTKLRSGLVRWETLALVAGELEIGTHLFLGHGEEQSGGRERERNLACAYEAVLGAILEDRGVPEVRKCVLRHLSRELDALPEAEMEDYKSLLQETVQAQGEGAPVYRTVSTRGPEHSKEFTVEVLVRSRVLGEGRGKSKRTAQRGAAEQALSVLAAEGAEHAD